MSILGLFDVLTVIPKEIGPIRIGISISETYSDELQITEHPVESGPSISDYAYKRQPGVVIKCGWSNADYAALLGGGVVKFDTFGSTTQSGYIDAVYSRLLSLQESRLPFDAVTSRRCYKNMLLKSLSVTHDDKTNAALVLTATLTQIRIAQMRTNKNSTPRASGRSVAHGRDPKRRVQAGGAGDAVAGWLRCTALI